MTIIIKNIYRTNLSQPGGLVRVLRIEESWTLPKRPICYVEHVETHPYGYEEGARGYYYPEDLVPVCQDCGHDLVRDDCEWCEMARETEEFLNPL